ncbi:MAG: signal peptidase II [Oscillospiraceae bacterium]|nr:signal peptidase II [Oscillospiraceae bacterium]
MIILSVILIIAMIGIDQITKLLVIKFIELDEIINVIKFGSHEIFSLTHVRNKGAAWSSFSSKTTMLTIITLILIVGLSLLLFVKPLQKKLFNREVNIAEVVSFSLIISGGIGNLIDRIRLKEVVDFIKADFINFPIFNFADICVVIGCFLFIIDILVSDAKENRKKRANSEKTDEQI